MKRLAKDKKKQEKSVSSQEKRASAAESSHPLFYRTPVAIDIQRHAKAGILPSSNLSFAENANSVAINVVEFIEVSKFSPIVFTDGDHPTPLAILGLEQHNYFVDSKGAWKEDTYIPAYIRKYPFAFMEVAEHKQFVLCVDESAPFFCGDISKKKDAESFFDGDKPSALTRNALEFCTAFHNHHQLTKQFCGALKELDLLVANQTDAVLASGRKVRLSGFQVIDEKKFNELPQDVILSFHKKGWLPYVYMVLVSASNWKRILHMASKREQ
ncbi:MAG: SapC family protein [Rickettsiales bacterium]|nr:SapC family protein [Rickettsiales bacterium]